MKYAAVIADTRQIKDEVIQNHLSHLDGWDLVVFTHKNYYIDYPHTRHRFVDASVHGYNKLLTSRDFWRKLLRYEYVLIFQQDSALLRGGIDEFFGWDYVGAPWKAGADWARPDRKGGNGGLSLRKVSSAMDLLLKGEGKGSLNEDIFFTRGLDNCAPFEVCRKFSVESEFALGSLGYHAIDKHLTRAQCEQIKNQYL